MQRLGRLGVCFAVGALLLGACGDDDDDPHGSGGAFGAGGARSSGGAGGKGNAAGSANGGRLQHGGAGGELQSGGAFTGGASSGGASITGGAGAGGVHDLVACPSDIRENADLAQRGCLNEGEQCDFGLDCCCGVCRIRLYCSCEDHTWRCFSEDWCREGCGAGGAGGQGGASTTR